MVVQANKEPLVWVPTDHVPEQMLTIATEIVVFVVAIVDFPETVHVHLAHERDGLLSVELVVWSLQVVGLKLVPVQVDTLAILRPAQAVLDARIVYELPQFLRKQLLVLIDEEATRVDGPRLQVGGGLLLLHVVELLLVNYIIKALVIIEVIVFFVAHMVKLLLGVCGTCCLLVFSWYQIVLLLLSDRLTVPGYVVELHYVSKIFAADQACCVCVF